MNQELLNWHFVSNLVYALASVAVFFLSFKLIDSTGKEIIEAKKSGKPEPEAPAIFLVIFTASAIGVIYFGLESAKAKFAPSLVAPLKQSVTVEPFGSSR